MDRILKSNISEQNDIYAMDSTVEISSIDKSKAKLEDENSLSMMCR
jgi:hypothetical protein